MTNGEALERLMEVREKTYSMLRLMYKSGQNLMMIFKPQRT